MCPISAPVIPNLLLCIEGSHVGAMNLPERGTGIR